MVKLKKHLKKLTAAALAGMVALALFTPDALAASGVEYPEPEAASFSDDESAAEASYSVKLAAWADAGFDPDDADGALYHTGKNFCVDVVVSGDSFSAFQGKVMYDSDRLIYDAEKTAAELEKNKGEDEVVTIEAPGDGAVSVIRTGKATGDSKNLVATLYFTAKKDGLSEISISDVKIGLGGGSAVLPNERITSCIVDVTKSYMMTDIVLGEGDVKVNISGKGYNIDINGAFAVDLISAGRDIECAELTVSYDNEKLAFDRVKTEASKADECTVSEISRGKITVIRNSSGIKAGDAIARLYFNAAAPGVASVNIDAAKAGTSDVKTEYPAEDLTGCSIKVNMANEITGVQSVTGLKAPVKNAAPYTAVKAPAKTAASVKWYDGDKEFTGEKFAASTKYTAKVTLTPDEGYQFAPDVIGRIDGHGTSVINDDGTLTITYTYPATADREITDLKITAPPSKTAYVEGQKFEPAGMIVKAWYDDGSSAEVTEYTITPSANTPLNIADTEVTVSYGGETAVQGITVEPKAVGSIAVTKAPAKELYIVGEELDTAGLEVTATYNDGTKAAVDNEKLIITGFDPLKEGKQTITVEYASNTATFTVTVSKYTISADDAFIWTLPSDLVYDGAAKTATVTAKAPYDGTPVVTYKKGGQTIDAPKTVGTYDVYVSAAATDKYKAVPESKIAGFTILKKSITVPTAAAASFVYDGQEKTAVASGDGYTVTDGSATRAGSYTAFAKLTDTENTQWSDGTSEDKSFPWSIAAAKPSVSIAGINKAVYGDTSPIKGAAAVILNGKAVTDGGNVTWSSSDPAVAAIDASTGEVTILKAGTTDITATVAAAEGKYEPASATTQLIVEKRALTVSVTADPKAYDGTTSAELKITVSGIAGNDQVTVTADGVYDSAAAGSRTIAVSNYQLIDASGNYTFDTSSAPASIQAEITKLKAADVKAEITASDLTQTEGDVKKPEVNVTPDVGDKTVKYLIKKPAADGQSQPTWEEWTDQNAPSAAGTYDIRAEIKSPNVDGAVTTDVTLTVNRKSSGGGSGGGGGGGGGGGSPSVTAYGITVTQSEGGEVKTSVSKASAGAAVTVTATPANGYTVSGVTVKNASTGAEITAAKNADGTYSFNMPAGAVTVSASFVKSGAEQPPAADTVCEGYRDINTSAWYHSAVHYVISDKIMTGTSEDTFAPSAKLSRAMLAQILYNQAGKPSAGNSKLNDVKSGDWFAQAVAWASESGIVTGYEDGSFRPYDYITREQLAAMLYRYAGSPDAGAASLSGFDDASSASVYAQDALKWAVSKGIITGDGSASRLNPKGTASRAQAAAMIMRYIVSSK